MFLCFLLLASVSLAKDYEVSVEITPKMMSVSPCGIANFDIDVTNIGELEDTYSISIGGLPKDWYSLSLDSVTLEPEESQKIYLFITPYCYDEGGEFKGSVMVTGKSNDTDTFTMNVVSDHEIEVSLPEEIKVCLQEPLTVTATIENIGKHTEELTLEISGNSSDFVELTEESLTLDPEESVEVDLTITPTELGVYSLEMGVESLTSYAKSLASSVVNVVECYGVDVLYPEEVEVCVNEETEFEITLENVGLKEDSYKVEIEDLDYVETVELEPDELKTLEIDLFGKEVGSYDISFMVESGFVTEEGVVEFVVLKCYDVDLTVEEDEFEIESGRGKLVKVQVKNTGSKKDEFEIISDVDWVSIKPSSVSLKIDETANVYVYYSPRFGMEGMFNASLTVKSENSEDTENLKITVSEVIIPIETTTTTVPPLIEIPTGDIVAIWERIWGSRVLRSLLIAVIVVLIIIIAIYLVIMR